MTALPDPPDASMPPCLTARLNAAAAEGIEPNIKRWLRFVSARAGDAIELQALNVRSERFADTTMVAHASHTSVLIDLLTKGERLNAVGLYTVANRVNPIVSTRQGRGKWHVAKKGESTTDRDILSRQVLIIDCDATRPKGTSASDAEVARAHDVAARIREQFIALLGSDASIGVGHTGNGAMVLLALDSLEESPTLVEAIKTILAMVSELFGTAHVSIDRSVSDAKRLVPAWGTRKRKGAADVPERPHRLTSFLCADKVHPLRNVEVYKLILALSEQMTEEQLKNVRLALGEKPAASAPSGTSADRAPLRDTPFGRVNSIPIERVVRWLGLLEGDEVRCPGCKAGGDSSVALVNNGLKCLHASCAGKGRSGFRTPIDLVCEVRGVTAIEAVKLLAEQFGVKGFATSQPSPTPEQATSSQAQAPRSTSSSSTAARERRPLWRDPAERALCVGVNGVRLATGLPTLDKATRGGFLTGKVVAAGGAPGAGKTTLWVQIAHAYAKRGIHVAIVAADEEANGLLIRLGQQEGLSRDDLENGDEMARCTLAARLTGTMPNLMLVDVDEDEAILEDVSTELARRAVGQPSVLVVDSLQTVRTATSSSADGPRARVDIVMETLKRVAKVDHHLVLATSELARGAYRSQKDRIDDLAAFKESGGIEHGIGMDLLLRNVPGTTDLVEVAMPKNRMGEKLLFYLELDREHARFAEAPAPPGREGGDDGDGGDDERIVEATKAKVLKTLRTHTNLRIKQEICDKIKCRRAMVLAAIKILEAEKAIGVVANGCWRILNT